MSSAPWPSGLQAAGIDTLIATSDKDMAQLVNGHIRLFDGISNRELDSAGVLEKFGVPPERIIDYLTLVGDTSDNIPGVPSVGPKTAAKWLAEYGSLDAIVARAGEIKGKVGEKLRDNLGHIPLSRQLATIHVDVPLELKPEDLVAGAPDVAALKKLAEDLEIRSLLRVVEESPRGRSGTRRRARQGRRRATGGLHRPPRQTEAASPVRLPDPVTRHYETILTAEQFDAWLILIENAELVAFDTETTSLNYMDAEVVGLSFGLAAGQGGLPARRAPLRRRTGAAGPGGRARAPQALAGEPGRPQGRPSPEIRRARARQPRHPARGHALRLHAGVLRAGQHGDPARHGLGGHELPGPRHDPLRGRDRQGCRTRSPSTRCRWRSHADYAAEDADITLRLHQVLWPRLEATPGLARCTTRSSSRWCRCWPAWRRPACWWTPACCGRCPASWRGRWPPWRRQAHEAAGHPFNIDSPKQLQEVLYDELKLPGDASTRPRSSPPRTRTRWRNWPSSIACPG